MTRSQSKLIVLSPSFLGKNVFMPDEHVVPDFEISDRIDIIDQILAISVASTMHSKLCLSGASMVTKLNQIGLTAATYVDKLAIAIEIHPDLAGASIETLRFGMASINPFLGGRMPI